MQKLKKDKFTPNNLVKEEKLRLSKIYETIKAIPAEEIKLHNKKTNSLIIKNQEKIKELLLQFPKVTLVEMLQASIEKSQKIISQQYFTRRLGKEKQMKSRELYEKLAEEVYVEMLTRKEKLSLEKLTFALANKYPDIRWQNNSDPDLTEKKLKDVVKLKAIYSKLRKKYVR